MSSKLQSALAQLEKLLRFLHAAGSAPMSAADFAQGGFFMFSRGDESLSLTGDEAIAYSRMIDEFTSLVSPERFGRATIQNALQEAVLGVIFGKSLDQDVKGALLAIQAVLDRPLQKWTILLPVRGLKPDKLPASFGQFKFIRLNQRKLQTLRRNLPVPKKHRRIFVPDDLPDNCFGQIRVEAVDAEAAQYVARRRLRQTINVLNFFAEFLTHASPRAFLPGERERTSTVQFYVLEAGSPNVSMPMKLVGPISLLDLKRLLNDGRSLGMKEANDLLRLAKPNEVQRRLLRACEAAGRAALSSTDDAALLNFVTALEAAILGPDKAGELSYRLQIRVGRLLGKKPQSRKEIAKKLAKIYSARSAVSHTGSDDVDPDDLNMARIMARSCVVHLLKSPKTKRFTKNLQLDEWFNEMALR